MFMGNAEKKHREKIKELRVFSIALDTPCLLSSGKKNFSNKQSYHLVYTDLLPLLMQ
jgi:hypothetical protein